MSKSLFALFVSVEFFNIVAAAASDTTYSKKTETGISREIT
jgi:hypothetical protein